MMPTTFQSALYTVARSKISIALLFVLCAFSFPRLLSVLSTDTFSPGDRPSALFFVAVVKEGGDQAFELIPFGQAMQEGRSLWARPTDLTIQTGEFSTIEYHVREQDQDGLLIETASMDDDYRIFSRYRLEDGHIVPLTRTVFGIGHGFAGFTLAGLVCAAFFYFLRRCTEKYRSPDSGA